VAMAPAPTATEPAPVAVAPAYVAPVAVTPVAAAQVIDPVLVSAPSAPAPVADVATLHAIVQAAGLQWIESDPIRVAQTLAEQPAVSVKLGRERKPAVVISSEPLVQVETRA
jgi:ribonuclease E